LTWRFLQAKQSSVAPVAGALLLRFLGAAAALLVLVAVVSAFWTTSAGWAVVDETAMVGVIKEEVLLQYSTTLHLQDVDRV
jgi:hypothetical protein